MTDHSFEERLTTKLQKRIKGAAYNVARQYNADPDDVEQDIILAILERYVGEPEFLNQTDAYIVNHGAWRARDTLHRQLVQANRCQEDVPLDNDDPNSSTLLDTIPSTPWPEIELGMDIESALAPLNRQNQNIARMLATGHNATEISAKVGISYKTVYNRMRGPIATALSAVA